MSSVLTPPDLVVISQNPGIQCHHPKFFVLIHSTKAVSSVKVMFSTATANRRFMAGSRFVLSQQASIFGSHGDDPGDAVSGQTVFDCYFMERVSLRTKSISILAETKAECDEIQRGRCRQQAGSHDEQPYRAGDINQQNGGRGQDDDQPSQRFEGIRP